MKKILLLLGAILLCIGQATAETKVLERSSKKAPSWVNSVESGYEIVSVQAASIASAQKDALQEISHRIIRSVAQNVSVKDTNISSEVVTNGNVESSDSYTRISEIASANLPFVKGISLSRASDIYWERVMDKQTKKEYYNYWVKYPFSSTDLSDLIREFEKLDEEKTAEYNAIESQIDNLESVEQIAEAITKLDALKAYFFDRTRLAQVEGLTKRYKALYNMIVVEGDFAGNGTYQCYLTLNGRTISTATPPTVSSECALINGTHQNGKVWQVKYDATDCLDDEINSLNIKFRLANKILKYTATIPSSTSAAGSFSVVPEGTLVLAAESADSETRTVSNIVLRMTLNNRGGTEFAVKSLELNVPELTPQIVLDNIDATFSTSGITYLKVRIEGVFTVKQENNAKFDVANGNIVLVNPATGSLERKKVSLPYTVNWHE